MKIKKIVTLVSLLCIGSCAFGLTACAKNNTVNTEPENTAKTDWENALNFTDSTNYKLEIVDTYNNYSDYSSLERDGYKVKWQNGSYESYVDFVDGKYYEIYSADSYYEITETYYNDYLSVLWRFPFDKFAYDEEKGGYVNTESYYVYNDLVTEAFVQFDEEGCFKSSAIKYYSVGQGLLTEEMTATYGDASVTVPELVPITTVKTDWQKALDFTINTNYVLTETVSYPNDVTSTTTIERDGDCAKVTTDGLVTYLGKVGNKFYSIESSNSYEEITEDYYLSYFSYSSIYPENKFTYDEANGEYVVTEAYVPGSCRVESATIVFNQDGCVTSLKRTMTTFQTTDEETTVSYGTASVTLPTLNNPIQKPANPLNIDWEASLDFDVNTNFNMAISHTYGDDVQNYIVERDGDKLKLVDEYYNSTSYCNVINGRFYQIDDSTSYEEITRSSFYNYFSSSYMFPQDKYVYNAEKGGYVNQSYYIIYGSYFVTDGILKFNEEGCLTYCKIVWKSQGIDFTMEMNVTYGDVSVTVPKIGVEIDFPETSDGTVESVSGKTYAFYDMSASYSSEISDEEKASFEEQLESEKASSAGNTITFNADGTIVCSTGESGTWVQWGNNLTVIVQIENYGDISNDYVVSGNYIGMVFTFNGITITTLYVEQTQQTN